jgi:hypothetical protein
MLAVAGIATRTGRPLGHVGRVVSISWWYAALAAASLVTPRTVDMVGVDGRRSHHHVAGWAVGIAGVSIPPRMF